MRILFTGASSKLGAVVLDDLLKTQTVSTVWCGVHEKTINRQDKRIRSFPLDLSRAVDLSAVTEPIDLLVHFASVTRSLSEHSYWDVNWRGTMGLIKSARLKGIRRLLYISTRCIGANVGAYGQSKMAAEETILNEEWDSLLIVRPAEVYGIKGGAGIDSFLNLGRRYHVVPMLIGHPNIVLSPLHIRDFVRICRSLIFSHQKGVRIMDVFGPENMSGVALALRIARRYRALPVPIWLPAITPLAKLGNAFGMNLLAPDQVSRLLGDKVPSGSSDDPALKFEMTRFLA